MEYKVESKVKEIASSQEKVYAMLSDLSNLGKVMDKIPAEYAKDLSFDKDNISISVAPVGCIAMQIIEREEPKTIKFETVKSPVASNLWIQILPINETNCKIKLTIKANINMFIKAMIGNKLQEGVDQFADRLAQINYE